MTWKDHRAKVRGPLWRRGVYWTARGLALLLAWLPVAAAIGIGWLGEHAADRITGGLTRIEGWAWPGLYAKSARDGD